MGQLILFSGVMSCGKSTRAKERVYNLRNMPIPQEVVLVVPADDTRKLGSLVSKHTGPMPADVILERTKRLVDVTDLSTTDVIIIDEAQFLTKKQIEEIWTIVHVTDIKAYAYSLHTDFRGEFFEGSQALAQYADVTYQMNEGCCSFCGDPTRFNAREIIGKGFVSEGEVIVIDDINPLSTPQVRYVPMCGQHFFELVKGSNPELLDVREHVLNMRSVKRGQ